MIPIIHKSVLHKVQILVDNAYNINFTIDIWTNVSNHSFLSVIGHCLDENFTSSTVVLRVVSFDESHTAANISTLLQGVLSDYNIAKHKVHIIASDNAANITKGIHIAGCQSLPCFLHTLQLVIKDTLHEQRIISDAIAQCRSIVSHFSHSSLACAKLNKLQEQHKIPQHSLVQDVTTQWNSTFLMLQRMVEQKKAIISYVSDAQNHPSLDGNKWNLLSKLLSALRKFHEVTVSLSRRQSLISEIIPQIAFLEAFIMKVQKNPIAAHGIGTTLSKLQAAIIQRCGKYCDNHDIILATFLDPRYKDRLFMNTIRSSSVGVYTHEHLQHLMFQTYETLKDENVTSTSGSNTQTEEGVAIVNDTITLSNDSSDLDQFDLDQCFAEMQKVPSDHCASKSKESFIESEFQKYILEQLISNNKNPLEWWQQHLVSYSLLSGLASKFLCAPPFSIESERFFSTGGNIFTPHRNQLLPQTGQQLMFLNCNIRLFDFKYN